MSEGRPDGDTATSGIHITQAQVSGFAATMYVAGACAGALSFGWLTDRYGRTKLFMITLGTYLLEDIARPLTAQDPPAERAGQLRTAT
jgi:MFS family permease